jgi:hypothetical protein
MTSAIRPAGLSAHCLRTLRCSRTCSIFRRSLAGETAHMQLYRTGIYCRACCPVRQPTEPERELELFGEKNDRN